MKTLLSVLAVGWCGAVFAGATVEYEQFGAKGDGKTDDRAAIIAAHEAANRLGASVRAKDGATYYVASDVGTAVVKTDVDFGTAKFVIDDTKIKNICSPLFCVEAGSPKFSVEGVKSLKKGQTNLGVRLPSSCLVKIVDSKVKRYIRFGPNQDNGHDQQEMVMVSKEGEIDGNAPLIWDYPEITAIEAFPIDDATLTIKGGVFVTIANQAESRYRYHHRGIVVNRSNVVLSDLRHEITGELDHGAPYAGFIVISHCANVTVRGCVLSGHRTYETIGSANVSVPMGSYDLSVGNAVNISFIDSRQITDINDSRYWGIFGSSYCKNILFDSCEFSRFDAHMGVANATIRNSKLGYMGIHAIGFGTFLVENTTVSSKCLVELRSDYGSTWDGDFVIRNCTFIPYGGKPKAGSVFAGWNDGQHDFGYVCRLPRKVTIDGLFVDDANHPEKYAGPTIFGAFNPKMKDETYVEKFPYVPTEEVVLSNVRTASGKPLGISPNEWMFRNTKIVRK